MRKFLISAAVAASALTAVASPAAAQYYPQQGYGYAQPNYGYNQGYNNRYNRGDARFLIARVDQVRQQIRMLARNRSLSGQEAYRLDYEALQLRNMVRQSAYNGIDRREQWQFQRQIQRLEQRVSYNANDHDGRYDRGSGFGYQNQYGQYQYGQQNGDWQNGGDDHRDGDRHDNGDDRDND